jgi:biotin transport system substrate-specific component
VPVTFQTLAVFLNGALLGFIFGPISVLLYLMYGAIGAPFFATQTGGVKILQGPTSGYLLGFILAAFVVGTSYEDSVCTPRY